ncbi:MAG TPA: penicillin-binding protein activator [Burkholderiaceae bacterium]
MQKLSGWIVLSCLVLLGACSSASSCGYGRICARPILSSPMPPDTPLQRNAPPAVIPAAPSASAPVTTDAQVRTFAVPAGGSAAIVPASTQQETPPAPIRMALLLPLRSENLGTAAASVRAGFMAAFEREPGTVQITVFDTTDAPAQIVDMYQQAQQDNDVVIGPLLRQAVSAIAQSGQVGKPTIALNQPEGLPNGDPADLKLPPKLLLMGLSVEDEARQVARWAQAEHGEAPAYAVYGHSPWQKRAARAFAAQRLSQGLPTKMVQVAAQAGEVRSGDVLALNTRLQADTGSLVFIALDADAARELRKAVGAELPVYGTSQLNPNVLAVSSEPAQELNGVRLLDVPWQLVPEHTVAMQYPRQVTPADQKPNPDMARLYALGIDAYRVAREIAVAKRTEFELDGVTGKLHVQLSADGARMERTAQPAVYRDGLVTPWPAR